MIPLAAFMFYPHVNNVEARVTPRNDKAVVRPYGYWTEENVMDAVDSLSYEHIVKLVLEINPKDIALWAASFGSFCLDLERICDVAIVFAGIQHRHVAHCYQLYHGKLYPDVQTAIDSFEPFKT